MRIFVTGANGFIGGAIAARLTAGGHSVRGLVRDDAKAAIVKGHGIEPVLGSLDDAALLADEARRADAVVNAANSDHRGAADALVAALSGSGKPLLHTSGSSTVADPAMGEPSDAVFHEDTVFTPVPAKVARVALDRSILDAPGMRGIVICNTMIYGTALGVESHQIPNLTALARKTGTARYIGRGLNRWSNVHIEDVAELYALAFDKAPAGSFMYAENGEESYGTIAGAIATRLGLGPAQSLPAAEAIAIWGEGQAMWGLGSNSRVRGRFGKEQLGWRPKHTSVTQWILDEL